VAPPKPVVTAVAPKPPVVEAESASGSGAMQALLENPMLLPGAGVLAALLGGFAFWRLRSRSRKSSNETSFLESRLQPDSFFGASGGQRIDTRESTSSQGASSSMSYSLSQLDAIGDVDPVAEADVYLAYGRDLQAEEILKEAMRSNPERMAIRSKLLEVYAKRRDVKGFELLATQMHNLTRGDGEEWSKAQELGRSIDPNNVLYHPGGAPNTVLGAEGQPVEPLNASTMPYTAPIAPVTFQPAMDATLDSVPDGLDLDLDLGGEQPVHSSMGGLSLDLPHVESIKPSARMGLDMASARMGLDNTVARPAAGGNQHTLGGLDFDVSGFPAHQPAQTGRGQTGAGDLRSNSGFLPMHGDTDPLTRKLELAEEFRQIGDTEGARDLLEEVLAKAEGQLRRKAQAMLNELG
jgi:pilus assembly protein FimV